MDYQQSQAGSKQVLAIPTTHLWPTSRHMKRTNVNLQALNFLHWWLCCSLGDRFGGCAWRPPVWGSAEHRRGVPRWALLHLGVLRPPRKSGPCGRVPGGGAGLDPGCAQAHSQSSNNGWEGAAGPVSFSCGAQSAVGWFQIKKSPSRAASNLVFLSLKLKVFILLHFRAGFSSACPQVGPGLVS